MSQGRLSIATPASPGPGKYQDNSLLFHARSPSAQFNQSPKWGKKNTTAPGPGYYKVKETAIQPFSKSITFNKTKRQETFHSARGPGPGQYENSYRQKGTTGGFKIPKAKRYQASNKNPGPADYRPNQNAVRGKTPTAQIVMDEVDRMVKKMNAHRSQQAQYAANSKRTSECQVLETSALEPYKKRGADFGQGSVATATTRDKSNFGASKYGKQSWVPSRASNDNRMKTSGIFGAAHSSKGSTQNLPRFMQPTQSNARKVDINLAKKMQWK